MPSAEPTILATSGGYRDGARTRFEFGPLVRYAVDLSGTAGRPKVCCVSTACGDHPALQRDLAEAGRQAGFELTHLTLFPMPNLADIEGHLLDQDVVWVHGGSVVNLLAVWRAHHLEQVFHRVWRAGVVLSGISAGSICWHRGGTTDSFGLPLQPVTDGLGLLPYGNGVHYDVEPGRRPLVQHLVARGTLPTTYCTDDGVGLVYRGTHLEEAVSESRGKGAYVVSRSGDRAIEERIEPRVLPAA